MTFESDVVDAIESLVSDRLFADFAPSGTAAPYMVYQQVGGVAVNFVESAHPGKRNARLQLSTWSTTRQEAANLARQAEAALVASTTLRAFVLSAMVATFDEDTALYGAQQDFSVWY